MIKYKNIVFFILGSIVSFLGFIAFNTIKTDENEAILQDRPLAHVAIVVKDIEKTTEAYAKIFGIKKPKIKLSSYPVYKGKETKGRAKMAFVKLNNMTLEIFEPVDGPTTWKDFLEEKGEGVHHFGIWIDGMEEKVDYFTKEGKKIVQSGGGAWGRLNYIDLSGDIGVMIELMEKAKEE